MFFRYFGGCLLLKLIARNGKNGLVWFEGNKILSSINLLWVESKQLGRETLSLFEEDRKREMIKRSQGSSWSSNTFRIVYEGLFPLLNICFSLLDPFGSTGKPMFAGDWTTPSSPPPLSPPPSSFVHHIKRRRRRNATDGAKFIRRTPNKETNPNIILPWTFSESLAFSPAAEWIVDLKGNNILWTSGLGKRSWFKHL